MKKFFILFATVTSIMLSCGTETDKKVNNLGSIRTEAKENAVYVTQHGKRYHRADCSTISGPMHHVTEMSRSEAESSGRTPCMRCNP